MFGLPQPPAAESADDFRKRFQEEHGEAIELIIVASSVDSEPRAGTGKPAASGVLVLSDRAVHFIPMQSYHWLMSMLRQSDSAKTPAEIPAPVAFVDIESVTRDKRSVLDLLFGAGTASFSFVTKDQRRYRFATPMPEDFVKRLAAHIGR